jgi:hypothetical protein
MEQTTRPVRLYYNGKELEDCNIIIQYQMTKCNDKCKTYLETLKNDIEDSTGICNISSIRIINYIQQGFVIY